MSNRKKNTVFAELSLIELIISDYWKLRENIESVEEELLSAQHWFVGLTIYSELILDMDKNDFIEAAKSNPVYRKLLKSSVTEGSKVDFWKSFNDELELNLRYLDFNNAIFLLDCTSEECKSKCTDYGLLFLNKNNYKSFTERLFLLTDFQVNKNAKTNDLHSWSDLNKIYHPMNCLMITDNYVLKSENWISRNLILLLDAFLPIQLSKINFQISIITAEMEDQELKKRYTYLVEQFKNKLKRPYEIELSIITTLLCNNHDRHIFTNYFRFSSGNSFNYFDNSGNVKVNTYLNAFPAYFVASGAELFLNKNLSKLTEIKSLVINHTRQHIGINKLENNRLFNMIP
ncbi:MAG: hypothetical protein ACOH2V_13035 [Candidatus Saccharimonadaceae bacterium]